MAHDEDDFRIRSGKVRDRDDARRIGVRARPTSFMGEVHQAIRRAGGNPNRLVGTGKGGGRFNARGRGVAAALTLKGRSAWSRDGSGARTRARRVAVKARVVKLWRVLKYDPRQSGFVIDLDRSRLEKAPSYAATDAPNWADRNYGNRIDTYYGLAPYWGMI